jgi:dihydrofolate synthase/folylpolyglutamate synthase
MLANKQGPELVAQLLAAEDQAWIVPVPGHASWTCQQLVAALPQLADQLHPAADLEQAVTRAQRAAAGERLILAGSLYLIGDLLAAAPR